MDGGHGWVGPVARLTPMWMAWRRRLSISLVGVALLVSACADIPSDGGTGDGGTDQGSITTSAPDTTSAPGTSVPDTTVPETSPPETTVADTSPPASEPGEPETDGGLDASAIWVVVGLVLVFVLLGWLMGRSRKPAAPAPVSAPTWRDHLREGYGEARWLSDNMTEELAVWRGNSLADTAVAGAGTAMADRWNQLDIRVNQARDLLYQAEAGAPDPTTSRLIRDAIVRLDAARASVDARAEARLDATRSPGDAGAAERERISSTNLAEARAAQAEALSSLSGLI
ncbi:MAG: hypothetical protein WAL25_01960 [Acidimicrobiia bacterium]